MTTAAQRNAGARASAIRSELLAAVPQLSIVCSPTPISTHDIPHGANSIRLVVKRDDATHPLYGGNKVRKLAFVLAAARARGVQRILTAGPHGSHHVLATAIFAQQLGLRVEAVCWPRPLPPRVRANRTAIRAWGARVRDVESTARAFGIEIPTMKAQAALSSDTMWVGPGASSPLGTLGYVVAALEWVQQVAESTAPPVDSVWVPVGSGGTAAGLVVGLSLAGVETPVCAVPVVPRWTLPQLRVQSLIRRTRHWIRQITGLRDTAVAPKSNSLKVFEGYMGSAYGAALPHAATLAESLVASGGPRLDETYTEKCLKALADACRAGRVQRPLLWNTYCSAPAPLPATTAPAGPHREVRRSEPA